MGYINEKCLVIFLILTLKVAVERITQLNQNTFLCLELLLCNTGGKKINMTTIPW